jgi:hypothetical protein
VISEQDVLFIIFDYLVLVLYVSRPSPGTSSSLKVLDSENKDVSYYRSCFDGEPPDLLSSSEIILIKLCEFADSYGIKASLGGHCCVVVKGDKEF